MKLQQIVKNVSRETFEDLCYYEEELKKWQAHINLISQKDSVHIWERHILDSIQIASLKGSASHWLDVGSGGGFPGIVVAIYFKKEKDFLIELVESNHKKAAFLSHIQRKLKLPLKVHAKRIEEVYSRIEQPEIVSARALASLEKLFSLCEYWLTKGAKGLYPKGKDADEEIKEAQKNWHFSLKKHKSLLQKEATILEISDLQKISEKLNK